MGSEQGPLSSCSVALLSGTEASNTFEPMRRTLPLPVALLCQIYDDLWVSDAEATFEGTFKARPRRADRGPAANAVAEPQAWAACAGAQGLQPPRPPGMRRPSKEQAHGNLHDHLLSLDVIKQQLRMPFPPGLVNPLGGPFHAMPATPPCERAAHQATVASVPGSLQRAVQQAAEAEECAASDFDDDDALSEASEPGCSAELVVGPTDLAVQPYRLEDLCLPDRLPSGHVVQAPLQSGPRCVSLRDMARLSAARPAQAPLSFGSTLHLNYGGPQSKCRPCMFERWAGRCTKSVLCDFCHMHENKGPRDGAAGAGGKRGSRVVFGKRPKAI